jgi:hypothetical protein
VENPAMGWLVTFSGLGPWSFRKKTFFLRNSCLKSSQNNQIRSYMCASARFLCRFIGPVSSHLFLEDSAAKLFSDEWEGLILEKNEGELSRE